MKISFNTLSKKRLVFLSGEVSDQTCLEVLIDDKNYSNQSQFYLKKDKIIVYKFSTYSHEYGFKSIKIKVISGSLKITNDSGRALYPGFFEGFHKQIKYQSNYINWFYSTTHKLGVNYGANSVIKFKHLYVNGPSFTDKNGIDHFLYSPLNDIDIYGEDKNSITEKLLQS